jgi:hypothetical protein
MYMVNQCPLVNLISFISTHLEDVLNLYSNTLFFEGFTHVYILFRQLLKHHIELAFALFSRKASIIDFLKQQQ